MPGDGVSVVQPIEKRQEVHCGGRLPQSADGDRSKTIQTWFRCCEELLAHCQQFITQCRRQLGHVMPGPEIGKNLQRLSLKFEGFRACGCFQQLQQYL